MGHFCLDIDPEPLRAAARKLRTLSVGLDERASAVKRTPGDIGSDWTGLAARSVKKEMTGLGGHLAGFSVDLSDTRGAVVRLAGHYDDALARLRTLNRRWCEADEAYDAAVGRAERTHEADVRALCDTVGGRPNRALTTELDDVLARATSGAHQAREAERTRLRRSFASLQEEVRGWTRTCAQKVAREIPLPVPPVAIDAYHRFGTYHFILDRSEFSAGMPLTRDLNALETQLTIAPQEGGSELDEFIGDQKDKKYFTIGDAATIAGGELIKMHKDWYREAADYHRRQAAFSKGQIPGSFDRTSYYANTDRAKLHANKAAELDARARGASSRLARGIPVVGWGITAAGIGYDISEGSSPSQSIVSGLAGAGGAAVAVAVASGPLGWGTLGVVAAGVGVGMVASWGAEKVWEALPDDVTDAIDEGLEAAGEAIADGAKSAWNWAFG